MRTSAFEALAREVHAPLYRYAWRRVGDAADDVVAETLFVAWRRFDEIPADAALAWCYGVARRCIANAERGRSRRLRLVDRIGSQPRQGDDQVASPDADAAVHDALGRLDEGDRELLRLWAWEGLEARDIAVVTGITANAASIRLHRARRRLRDLLGVEPAARRKDPPVRGQETSDDTRGEARER